MIHVWNVFFILPSFLLCNHYASCLELVGNFGFFGLRVFSLLVFKHRHFASAGHPSRSFLSLSAQSFRGLVLVFGKIHIPPVSTFPKFVSLGPTGISTERKDDLTLIYCQLELQLQRFTLIARVKCGQA